MKVEISMKVVGTEVKKGGKGDYLKVVAIQGADVIQTYSRNLQLPYDSSKEQKFLCEIKTFKGQLQNPEILKVI